MTEEYRHPAAISFQFDNDDDNDDNDDAAGNAVNTTTTEAAELKQILEEQPSTTSPPLNLDSSPSQAPIDFSPPPPPQAAAVVLASTHDLDSNFLQSLSNTRKLKKAKKDRGEVLQDNEELEVYREDPETEKQQIARIHRLREAAARDGDNDEEPLRFGEYDDPRPQPSSSSRLAAFMEDDQSHHSHHSHHSRGSGGSGHSGGSVGSGHSGGKKKKKRHHRRHEDRDDHRDDRDDREDYHEEMIERPIFKPRRSKAEMWAEERGHKAKCVARIEQLEAKGISCSLPEEIDWMSLPLSQLDDELTLMETKYKRKGKIVKMRAGFYALNKALTWGLTSHPGPDFLKFPRVKGFDKTVADEIDEFDDPLERLWDLWFGSSGEAHPLIEIAMLEAVILGNHVMRGDQGQNAKTKGGIKTKVDGDKSTSSGAASTTGLMSSLMSMLGQNPGMTGPVADALADRQNQQQQQQQRAQPQPQQQQPPAMPPRRRGPIDFGDFGMPPGLSSADMTGHDESFIAKSREFQRDFKAEQQAQTQTQAQAQELTMDDMLRSLMDDVVDKTASRRGGVGRVEEVIEENGDLPLDVDVVGRGGRGKR